MDLGRFLRLLMRGTDVRIKVCGYPNAFVGKTGPYKTAELVNDISLQTQKQELYVYAVYPLYSARELYIECF